MTGKWIMPGVPHRGWTCEEVIDLEEERSICEMCETQSIRFQHVMKHPEYPEKLLVGCDCAGHMENCPYDAHQREKAAKSKTAFIRRKWRTSKAGNPFLNWNGHHAAIWPNRRLGQGFHAEVDYEKLGFFFTVNEAKAAIFEATL